MNADQIPQTAEIAGSVDFTTLKTRNTKEAALLYSIKEVLPVLQGDGNLHAMRVTGGNGETCFFFFQTGKLAGMIQKAFSDPQAWCAANSQAIPDQYMPQVLTLILTMWHNWERLKDATKGLPLHLLARRDGKIFIKPIPNRGDSNGRH
jgi:hypothetical protein